MALSKLEELHRKTGELLTWCNRLLATVVLLGTAFCLMLGGTMHLMSNPEELLATRAFNLNYMESAEHEALANSGEVNGEAQRDPEWDGMLAGGSLGLEVGRSIPFVGVFIGPVVGAAVGYEMDKKI